MMETSPKSSLLILLPQTHETGHRQRGGEGRVGGRGGVLATSLLIRLSAQRYFSSLVHYVVGAIIEEGTIRVVLLVDGGLAKYHTVEDREHVPHHILPIGLVVAADVIVLGPHVQERLLVKLLAASHDGLARCCELATADVHHLLRKRSKALSQSHTKGYRSGH